jgi:hypothetical protein
MRKMTLMNDQCRQLEVVVAELDEIVADDRSMVFVLLFCCLVEAGALNGDDDVVREVLL